MENKKIFHQALLFRIKSSYYLAQKKETLYFLPEITLRTLRDMYRLVFGKTPLQNSPHLLKEMGIDVDDDQKNVLLQWENGLRGEEKYKNLIVNKEISLTILSLIEKKLNSLNF